MLTDPAELRPSITKAVGETDMFLFIAKKGLTNWALNLFQDIFINFKSSVTRKTVGNIKYF